MSFFSLLLLLHQTERSVDVCQLSPSVLISAPSWISVQNQSWMQQDYLKYFSCTGLTVFCRARISPRIPPDMINLLFHIYFGVLDSELRLLCFWEQRVHTAGTCSVDSCQSLLGFLFNSCSLCYLEPKLYSRRISPPWLVLVMKCSERKLWICVCEQVWLEIENFVIHASFLMHPHKPPALQMKMVLLYWVLPLDGHVTL